MASTDARPAARTLIPVTADSDALRTTLAEFGLGYRQLPRETSRLVHDLRLAGTSVQRPEPRDELRVHLAYWAAVRRLLISDPAEPPQLEGYDESIRDLEATQLLPRATGGAGLSQVEVRGFHLRGVDEVRFLVYGCRLVDGQIIDLHAQRVSFEESGVFRTTLTGVDADDFSAKFSGIISSTIRGHFRRADFSKAGMRDVDLEINVSGLAHFDDADLSDEAAPDLEDNLRDVPHWPRQRAGVRFTACTFEVASFRGSKLRGVTFDRCTFTSLRFDKDSSLQRAAFAACQLAGRPLTVDDLRDAPDGASALITSGM